MRSETLTIDSPDLEAIQLRFNSLDKNSLTGLSIHIENVYYPETPTSMGKKIMPHIVNLLDIDNNLTLLELNLSRIGLSEQHAKGLSDKLKGNQTIKTLNLSYTNIDSQGLKYLAEALEMNQSLENLDLSYNNIGPEGAKAIAEALKINESLKHLDLSYNKIGPKGAKAIGEALKINQSLKHLGLAWNTIAIQGTDYLVDGLENNFTLQSLSLATYEMTNRIQVRLEENQTLLTEQRFKKTKPVDGYRFFPKQEVASEVIDKVSQLELT